MSSAPTQIAVAPSSAGNLVTSSSGQIQKDYLEEPLARQNSLGNRGRGGLKGKALTRSHAMREAASPPRTPTPRSDQLSGLSPITSGNHSPSSPEINDSNTSKMHVQSVSSVTQTTMETPSVIITTQQQQQSQQQQQQQIQQNQNHSNVVIYSSNDNNANSGNVICNDVDFPKLTPPKSSKGARNRDNGNSSNSNHNNSNNGNNNGSGAGGGNNGGSSGGGNNNNNNNICNNVGLDNNNKTSTDHKIHQQQQQLQQSISSGDSTNYINGKKVVNDSSNSKSPNNHNNNNNINNSNGQNNNNSSINSNNNNDNSNIQINSSSTNTSNRNNNNTNLNNDSYLNHNNNNNNNNNNNSNNNNSNSSINVSVSQLNPQASPYINNSPISPPVTALSYDKDNRCPRNESQNSNNSGNYSQEDSQNCVESPNEKSDRLSKKHRNGANSKGTKPRLKNMSGSSSSMEGGNSTSGFISRDSSTEQFTDQSGIDLVQFFKETLNKSLKDRSTLMEIEKDLIELAHDKSQKELRFQPMSSYNRMLIHRVAAFFGMEHNVDKATQQCVIVAPTKATRIPDIRFKQLVRDEPRKSILKRDTHSFDDSRQGSYLGVDRGVLDRKAKSFEEREEEYQKARRRIFRGRESVEMAEEQYWGWSNNDNNSNGGGNCGPSPSNSGGSGGGNSVNNNNNNESSRIRQNNKLLKPMERQESRQNVSKSHNNFGGYGGPSSNASSQQQQNMQPLSRNDSLNSNKSSGQRAFSKQDSAGSSNAQSWRLSPSSSGYKTQTQSLRSDSITPSPTGGYGSSDDHMSSELLIEQTTAAPASCGVVWAVTDMASVPRGSVLINPHTLQPFVNQDGSVYHFDPSNLPPNQSVAPGMYNNNPNNTHRKNKMDRQKKSSSSEQHSNNCNNNNANTPSPGLSHNANSTTPTPTPIDSGNGNNLMNSNSNSTSTDTNTTGTTSIDNISEMSGQTVVNINPNNNNNGNTIQNNNIDIDDNDDDIDDSSTKENQIMISREMDDIEEEIVSNNYEECEKSTLKVDDEVRNLQEKPKFINQATSPNIPSPEPEYNLTTTVIIPSNEVGKPNIKSSTSDNQTPISISNVSTRSTPSMTLTDNKKDETKTISSNIPIMSYATGYQTLDGATVFQPAGTGPYTTTTYQQGPDGSVYAVPQQMVYTYPQPIDGGEIQGYFVYDQAAATRDGTTLVPTPVYQPSGGTTVVPVAAYPSNPFGSAPIYQQQVVYTPEQFPNTVAAPAATAAGQVQQYPVTYPVGYSYPYNGYWGQAMTYYVPQPPLTNAVSSSIIPPPPLPIVAAGTASTAQAVNIGSSINPQNNNNSHSGTVSGKRNTPPQQTQQHNHHHHHSHSNQQQQQQQQHHHHHHHQQQQPHHQSHHTQTQSQQQQQQQPQQQQQHQQNLSGQSSQSATPANATYQFATTTSTGVPVALTTDPNGPTMYAIPQSAVFPNAMLPYGHPPQAQLVPTTQATQAAPAGVITHLPHQSQTVISPMIAQPAGAAPPGSILPPQHISIDQTGAISIQQQPHTNAITHSISTNGSNVLTGNHGNRSCTPQSTPSTPVSTTLPTINHHHHPPHRNNPPLFATPPMIPNGFNSQIANNPYQHQHYTETHQHHHSSQQQQQQYNQQQSHSGITSSVSSSSYEKKNSYSNIKKNSGSNNNHNNHNNNNGGVGGYNSNNSGNRQNAYSNNINNSNQRKMHENTNSSVNNFSNSNSSSTNNSNNSRQIYNTGQSNNNKRINNIDKTQSSTTIGNAGANNTVGVQNNLISSTNLNSSVTAASITSNNTNSAQLNSDIKPRPGGIRQKPGNLDFKRNGSQRNSPSTNSAESNNNSPNSIASSHNNNHNNNNLNPNVGGGIPTTPVIMTAVTATTAPAEHHQPHPQTHQHQPQQQHQQTMYMARGTHIPQMHTPTAAAIAAATAAVVSDAAAAAAATHQPLIGAYNHHQVAPGGMYFKYGQTYFAHPSVATLPNNRRSPPNEIRPSLTPIYSAVNMMLPAPRQIQPRHPNPNYKGNKPSR